MEKDHFLLTFQADLKMFGKVMARTPAIVTQRITGELWRHITFMNPVKTGYSQANWNIGNGEIDFSLKGERPEPGENAEDYFTRTGGLGEPKINAGAIAAIDGTNPIYLTNAVNYVIHLENGSSRQAPDGFVAISLAKAEAAVNGYIRQAIESGFKG